MSMNGIQVYAYDAKIDGIYYDFSDTEAMVTYLSKYDSYNEHAYSGNVVIPEKVVYNEKIYTVTGISDYAFKYCSGLTSVTIPNSVTRIGKEAFYWCIHMTSVTIPSSVTKIGKYAFYNCSGKLTVNCNIPSVNDYYYSPFGYSLFNEVIIGNEVTSIGDNAFVACSNLTNITIPNSVTTIGSSAFDDCDNLESVIIGSGVISMGKWVFGHAPSKIIWLPNTPPQNYDTAQGKVNYVANDQYSMLNDKIVYPYLSSMFESEGIKYVPINPSERTCEAIDCVYDNTIDSLTIKEKTSFKGIEMTVKSINPYIFCGNPNLKNVKWEYGGNIPNSAFQNCNNLFSVDIADNTQSIGDYAFSDCSSLERINIGCGVLTIGNYAFQNCRSLKKIDIPKNVARISDYAFQGCFQLMNVILEEPINTENTHRMIFDDISLNSRTSSITYSFNVIAGDILTFDYDHEVGMGSQGNFKVTINDNIILHTENTEESYYIHKFDKTEDVKLNISISPGLWSNNIASVYNIEVGNDYSITFGSNRYSSIFCDCPLDSVIIGRNIKYVTSPFYNNKSLSSVFITNKETIISDNEFYGCAKLKNIIIGEEITTIGNRAFSGCTSLEKYICGSKVKTIGQEAFADCSAIKKIICHTVIPPTCGSQALDDINKWECTLLVPANSIAAYQEADQWNEFFFIKDIESGIADVKKEASTDKNYFAPNGKKFSKPQKGLNIVVMQDGTTRKVVK